MKRTSHGFTLVELLVVITIISILMGLLLPGVNAARESARRTQCGTQMKNFALAAVQYEGTNGALPGYMMKFGNFIGDGMGGPGDDPSEPGNQAIPPHAKIGTWAVAILPWLEQQPTYEHWTQDRYPLIDLTGGEYEPTNNQAFDGVGFHPLAAPNLAIFQCPSNPVADADRGRNSYIANTGDAFFVTNAAVAGDSAVAPPTGIAGPAWALPASGVAWARSMGRAQGLFNNKYQGSFQQVRFTGEQVRLTDIKDGADYTVMFSENVQALPWHRAGYINPPTHLTAGIDYSVTPPLTEVVFDPDLTSVPPNPLASARYTHGMVWHYEDTDYPNMPVHPETGITCLNVYVKHKINGRGQAVGQDIFTQQINENSGNYVDLARPSSAHVSGVNAAIAGGRTIYINETIDYRVWQALMTPRGKSSSVPFTEYVLQAESLGE